MPITISPATTLTPQENTQNPIDLIQAEHAPSADSEIHQVYTTDLGFLVIPKRLRYDKDKPFHFGWVLNAGFGIASTFSEFDFLRAALQLWGSRVHWQTAVMQDEAPRYRRSFSSLSRMRGQSLLERWSYALR